MPSGRGTNPLWPLLASLLIFNVACQGQTPKPISHNAVKAELYFSCLWWSEDQQENLKLSSPPPKSTEVKITDWQYSDPVSTPHPDQVDLVITLSNNEDDDLTDLDVDVSGEWKVGPLHQQAKDAAWGGPSVIKQFHDVSSVKAGKKTLRVSVDLKSKMDELDKNHKWPFAFRSVVTVHKAGSSEPLSKESITLPILPAD